MRLLMTLSSLVLTAVALAGQEKTAETKAAPAKGNEEAVIIPVKTLSGDSFRRLAKMLGVFNVRYYADDKLRTILVYAPPDVVAQMRRVVEQLDRPGSEAAIGRNIEMSMAFLRCSSTPQHEGRAVPADLESAARQLRSVTPYKSIELWDIVPIRMQEGKETIQNLRLPGSLPDIPGAFPTAEIRMLPEAVTLKDSNRHVRFDYLKIHLRIPYASGNREGPAHFQFNYNEVRLDTAGDFREGQKAILGKVSGMEDGTAVFVVISLKVLD